MQYKWLATLEPFPSTHQVNRLHKSLSKAGEVFLTRCLLRLQEYSAQQEPVPAEDLVETLEWAIEYKKPLEESQENTIVLALNSCKKTSLERWKMYVRRLRQLPWQEAAPETLALLYHCCRTIRTQHPTLDVALLLDTELCCFVTPHEISKVIQTLEDNPHLVSTADPRFFLTVSQAIVHAEPTLTGAIFKQKTLIWDPLFHHLQPQALEVLKRVIQKKRVALSQKIQRIIELKTPIQTEATLKTRLDQILKERSATTNTELTQISEALERLPSLNNTTLNLVNQVVDNFNVATQEGLLAVICALITRPEYAEKRDAVFRGLIHRLLPISVSLLSAAFNDNDEERFIGILDQLIVCLSQLKNPLETEKTSLHSQNVHTFATILQRFYPKLQDRCQEAVMEVLLLLPKVFPSAEKNNIENKLSYFFLESLSIFLHHKAGLKELERKISHPKFRTGLNTLIGYLQCCSDSYGIGLGQALIPKLCIKSSYTASDIELLKRGHTLGAHNDHIHGNGFGPFIRFSQVLNSVALIPHLHPTEAEPIIQETAALLSTIASIPEKSTDLQGMAPTITELIRQSVKHISYLPPKKAFAIALRLRQGCKAFQERYFPQKCLAELGLLDETINHYRKLVLQARV